MSKCGVFVTRLLAMADNLKVKVMLALCCETCRLKVDDIDSELKIIRVVQAKGRKDRHVMLPPEVLDLLRQWWKVRPTRYDEGVPQKERWLFPARRRSQPLTTRQLSRLFHEAAEAAAIKKPVCIRSGTPLPPIFSSKAWIFVSSKRFWAATSSIRRPVIPVSPRGGLPLESPIGKIEAPHLKKMARQKR